VQFGDVVGIVLRDVRAMDGDREMAELPVKRTTRWGEVDLRILVCRESGSLDVSIIDDFTISDLTTGLNR
jgi:hypothetical protein